MRKILAMTLAVVMVLVIGTVAFASENLTGGKIGDDDPAAKLENSVTFNKEIVLYNTTSAEVHYPAIQYTYTIAGATGTTATVTDSDSDVGVVYAGVGAGTNVTITSPVTFSNTSSKTNVTPNGVVASEPITVTVTDPDAFEHAGIFRYLITEGNNSEARTAAGVSRGDNYKSTRYLDIYVRRAVTADNTSSDFVIYGYVLFEGNDTSITSAETEVAKSQGFVGKETSGTYETTDVDYYETYNLKVTKNIAGTLAETSHPFPFSVAYTARVTTDAVIEWAKNGADTAEAEISNSTLTLGNATTTGYAESDIKLANGDYVTFYGIPAGTTSVVTEINDTYDIYKASQKEIKGGTSTAPEAINLAANHVTESIYSITAVANATTVTSNSEKDTELVVKNEMEIVSPTGVVLRVAPYALMLGAGIFLLLIARKRKNNAEEA